MLLSIYFLGLLVLRWRRLMWLHQSRHLVPLWLQGRHLCFLSWRVVNLCGGPRLRRCSSFFPPLVVGVGLWHFVLLVVGIGTEIPRIAVGVLACFLSS